MLYIWTQSDLCAKKLANPMKSTNLSGSFMSPRSVIFKWGKYLKGYCTPNQKLACFVLYLKIINTFLKIINVCYS